MRLGLPVGLSLFAAAAAYLAGRVNLPLAVFLVVFVLLIAESTALAMLTAHNVELLETELVGTVAFLLLRQGVATRAPAWWS